MLKFALYLILHQLICKFFFYFIYDSTEILETLEYDDNPPVDENGQIIQFNDKSTDSNDKNHLVQAENRKKKSN